MNRFTKALFGIALFGLSMLPSCAEAQSASPESVTNYTVASQPAPTITSGIKMISDAISAKNTNWFFEGHALYAPGLTKKYGGGIGAFYSVSEILVTGIRLDYVDGGFVMPSGSAGLQLPITPFSALPWFRITPFTYLGIGVPLSGAKIGTVTVPGSYRNNDGQPTAITGYGGAIQLYANGKVNIDLIGDRETWSGFNGSQYRFGLLAHCRF